MKRILAAALCLVMVFAFMGAMPVRADAAKTVYLTLAHNMAEDHAINVALTEWAEAVNEAMAALAALGYSNSEILPVLRKIPDHATLKRDELIRKALQMFAKR